MIAGPTAFSVRHGRSLVQAGLSPDLLALAARVSTALPRRIGAAPLRDFLLRHHVPLQAMLEDAFRSVPPAGHPLDVNPPRVGPIHRSMTLEEVEAAIRGEAEEYVVLFDADSQQVARFGPEGTWEAAMRPASRTC